MIKIQESVPRIYYNSSRDFQLIGHLFDLVLNSVKTEADLIFNLPLSTNSDDQLLELLTYTLGLRLSKEKYTSEQLRAICSVAPRMMRHKGSLYAIELLCNALMRADAIEGSSYVEYADNKLTVHITNFSTCHDILYEILPYIVPAGIIFNIKELTSYELDTTAVQTGYQDKVLYGRYTPSSSLNYNTGTIENESLLDFNLSSDNKASLANESLLSGIIVSTLEQTSAPTSSTTLWEESEED